MSLIQASDLFVLERSRTKFRAPAEEVTDLVIEDQDFPPAVRAANDDYEDFTLVFENALL